MLHNYYTDNFGKGTTSNSSEGKSYDSEFTEAKGEIGNKYDS